MWQSKRFLWAAALAGITLLAGVSVVTSQEGRGAGPQPPPAPPRLDRAKNDVIEQPVRNVVVNSTAPAPAGTQTPARAPALSAAKPLDITKSVLIEPKIKAVVANASAPALTPPLAPAADKFVNPKVQPGKVRWHATLADAQAASTRSKRPVLLFQMMGKLDDQFC